MIKAIITDVDGVLTDGGMYWNEQGLAMKRFHTKDIPAIHRLQSKGYKVFTLTSACDIITRKRLEYSGFDWFMMCQNGAEWRDYSKLEKAKLMIEEWGIELSETIYIGDDVMDIELMKACALGICPEDSALEVLEIADIVLPIKGGYGIISYVCSIIDNIEEFNNG